MRILPMYNGILVRYGEIFLKSKYVRKQFERVLTENIKRGLKEHGIKASTGTIPGRIIVATNEIEKTIDTLKHTFGVVSISPVVICKKTYSEIKKISKNIAKTFKKNTTFAIEAKRSDKSFLLDSQKLKEKIGAEICKLGFKVNLSKPKNKICIEIRDRCYVYDKIIQCPGGMPLGTAGHVGAPLRSREDLLSAWLMMKRGTEVVVIEKIDGKLFTILQRWSIGRKIKTVKNMNEAKKLEAIALLRKKKKNFVTFDPLVGYSKEEKAELYRFISS